MTWASAATSAYSFDSATRSNPNSRRCFLIKYTHQPRFLYEFHALRPLGQPLAPGINRRLSVSSGGRDLTLSVPLQYWSGGWTLYNPYRDTTPTGPSRLLSTSTCVDVCVSIIHEDCCARPGVHMCPLKVALPTSKMHELVIWIEWNRWTKVISSRWTEKMLYGGR